MNALSKIEKAGFKVFLDGDNLGITPAHNLTLSQREFLKSHRAELITELQNKVEWLELPDSKPNAVMVTCYTPNGNPIEVEARNEINAEFLQRMNPKPQDITK